ncbi:hypothetical protein AM493_10755 [Flavobacterium akiainvivens]|uniref:Uncharacterized protein n=1 Tax=Flavobacterium akiainvivens TaxID=1202724 RepID=A0A0M9VIC6_9FLAO|nr:hypothetical protein [Flavobacterium akiainvivens]KOS06462.1 hypothetical protein AM493_10755 [Flavobacterium akiainvivens]SFQ12997.1 hypothetical protein SAMN05444144_101211 [Flavobacterium akiainvivens]
MKWLVFLITVSISSAQNKDAEMNILKLELTQYPDLVNQSLSLADTIVIRPETANFNDNIAALKTWCLKTGELTQEQANEIFGEIPEKSYPKPNCPSIWSKDIFKGQKVILFDKNIHTTYTTQRNKETKKVVGINILSLTCPWIKNDGKYALIETFSEHYGGILSIYKEMDGKWHLIKRFQLYYT